MAAGLCHPSGITSLFPALFERYGKDRRKVNEAWRTKFGAASSVLMLSESVWKVIQVNHRRDHSTLAMSRTDRNM
ncbi:MAG: hypothetical protein PHH26_03985 [Candidatus Thermoplasmatota archaeon]|nr:hypothetical protein [Candidatus Thermoplasmatota archaeon]